jgi:hypothetical protein
MSGSRATSPRIAAAARYGIGRALRLLCSRQQGESRHRGQDGAVAAASARNSRGIVVKHLRIALGVALAAGAAGCDVGGGDVTAGANGASTVNGSVHVPAGLHSGKVDTVNGSIRIDENATVASASTVNGSISLGAHATADSLDTVNGSIRLDSGAHVLRAVSTVNGGLTLASAAEVGGQLRNVNGSIALRDAHVAQGLRTVNGNIDVRGSHIEGGIVVERSSGWFTWSFGLPRVVIGPGSVVQGDMRFERRVHLFVSDQATVGAVIGATAQRFAGDSAPN